MSDGVTSASTASKNSSLMPSSVSSGSVGVAVGAVAEPEVEWQGLGPEPVAGAAHAHVPQEGQGRDPQRLGPCFCEPGHRMLYVGQMVLTEHSRRHQQRVDIAEAERLAQLGRLVGRAERHADRTDPGGCQPRHDPVRAVGEHEPDAGALPHPGRQELLAHAAGRHLCLAVAHASIGHDDEVVVPKGRRCTADHGRNGRCVVQVRQWHVTPSVAPSSRRDDGSGYRRTGARLRRAAPDSGRGSRPWTR